MEDGLGLGGARCGRRISPGPIRKRTLLTSRPERGPCLHHGLKQDGPHRRRPANCTAAMGSTAAASRKAGAAAEAAHPARVLHSPQLCTLNTTSVLPQSTKAFQKPLYTPSLPETVVHQIAAVALARDQTRNPNMSSVLEYDSSGLLVARYSDDTSTTMALVCFRNCNCVSSDLSDIVPLQGATEETRRRTNHIQRFPACWFPRKCYGRLCWVSPAVCGCAYFSAGLGVHDGGVSGLAAGRKSGMFC